jgi:hypothetical protein
MVIRAWMRVAGAAAVLVAAVGACDAVIKIPDRAVGSNLSCANGVCTCTPGFGDCDGNPQNGCEASLREAPNCGACGNTCANGSCSAGACQCKPGFEDCDHDPKTGCEAELASDPRACGTCGHDCEGGLCASALCEPFVLSANPEAYTVELANGQLYVGECPGVGPLEAISVDGGAPVEVSAPTTNMDCGVAQALAPGAIYWAGSAAVFKTTLPPLGTTTTVLPNHASDLGVTADSLYWTAPVATTKNSQVMRAPLAGGASKAVSTNTVRSFAFAAATMYWADATAIWSITDAQTMPSSLATVVASSIAVDAVAVYAQLSSGLVAIPLDGSAQRVLDPNAATFAMATDATDLYYLDYNDGTLNVVPLVGGTIRKIPGGTAASGQAIVTDAQAVYFLTTDGLYKMVK